MDYLMTAYSCEPVVVTLWLTIMLALAIFIGYQVKQLLKGKK